MLQKALLNAHILYSKKKGKETFKQFQEHVIASLLFPDVEEQLEDVVLPMHAVLTRLTGQHFPSLVPYNENRGRYLHKKCVVCTKHGTRNDVKYICRRCVGQPGLCVASCFEGYHTKLHY